MENEKVISYLNVNNAVKADKSLPKIFLCFNIGLTAFLSIFSILLFPPSNYYIYILFGILDITYLIFLMKYHNPLWEIPLSSLGLVILIVKSFYGYVITSQFEFIKAQIPMFTWIHTVVLVLAIGITAYLWAKFYQAYKILKDNTIEEAKEKVASKNPMPKWVALIASLSGSPMILVRMLRDDFENLGLGLGFSMWALGVVFAVIFGMSLPKCVVLIRFRVWNFPEYRK